MSQNKGLLSFRIEQKIEEAILKKQYDVGDKLPTESQLCEQFSASRTVIREALNSLKARGLVEIKKGSGVYVSELTTENAIGSINLYFELSKDINLVDNAIQTRLHLEPEIASLAAMNRKEEHLIALSHNLEEIIECSIEDIERETELDIEFHILITKATGNPVISLIMEPVLNLISKYKPMVFGKHESLDRKKIKDSVIKFHSRIYEAVKSRNSREAYYEMREHLKETEKNSKEADKYR
ncbi:MAG: FadR/GntR family transcriptional regulator [Bacteroidota bacterium]